MHALLWLHFSLVNGGVEIQTPVRLERNRHGGGVILYVLKTILVLKKKNWYMCMYVPYIEIIWAETDNGHRKSLVGVLYRPPNTKADLLNLVAIFI